MPAMQHAASVGIRPTLNRKIAMAAATERTRAHRSTDDREHGRLEAEEQRDDDRDIAPAGVHVAQRHDGNDARTDEKPAGDDAAERAMHQPADIGRELLRLRARQQHAIIERMQEPLFRYPALLLDQNAMHDRDLAGGTAEAQG